MAIKREERRNRQASLWVPPHLPHSAFLPPACLPACRHPPFTFLPCHTCAAPSCLCSALGLAQQQFFSFWWCVVFCLPAVLTMPSTVRWRSDRWERRQKEDGRSDEEKSRDQSGGGWNHSCQYRIAAILPHYRSRVACSYASHRHLTALSRHEQMTMVLETYSGLVCMATLPRCLVRSCRRLYACLTAHRKQAKLRPPAWRKRRGSSTAPACIPAGAPGRGVPLTAARFAATPSWGVC